MAYSLVKTTQGVLYYGMRSYKYTKEQLAPLVSESLSIAEVGKKLGLLPSGGTSANLKRLFKLFDIDTSHFKGKASSFGERKKGGSQKKTKEEILVKRQAVYRENAMRLRRAMIDAGVNYHCDICGLPPTWNGMELRLQVDHKNGDHSDCRIENLRFTCPNCHTQTPNYGKNKGMTDLTSVARYGRAWRSQKRQERNAMNG